MLLLSVIVLWGIQKGGFALCLGFWIFFFFFFCLTAESRVTQLKPEDFEEELPIEAGLFFLFFFFFF
jgi:hypothetical protein